LDAGEEQMPERKVKVNKERCKGCMYCIEFCPKKSLVLAKGSNAKGYAFVEFTDDGKCTSCAICALMCPEAAIEVQKDV